MSYQVLARKWRPKNFIELVGQEHVKNTLINALDMGRLHHAYLFTGTRGVGKTTIARIFAKSLNCEQGVTSRPCGQCDACLSIEKGQFVDLIEIDAASRTKVEDTREILDNVQYAPTRGRFKVYLIDEVHMLSRHSFNALLKTLEEPPSHVKFLLATTDPQKLPITILSRCLQFNLKALQRGQIVTHLSHILTQEQIGFDQQSLKLLAKSADGSLRDALSLTDQAIAQSNGDLQNSLVQQMLGTIDQQWSLKLLADIVNRDANKALATVNEIAQLMPDYRQVLDQLLSIFHLGAMVQMVPNVAQIDENLQAYVTRLAQKLSPQDIQMYYQILLNGKKDIDLAPDPRMGFEMVLLRLMAFQPLNTIARPAKGDEIALEAPEMAAIEMPPANVAPSEQAKKNSEIQSTQLANKPLAAHNTAAARISASVPALKSELTPTPAPTSSPIADEDDSIQALNQQQNSLLLIAQQQGFSPQQTVEPQPAKLVEPQPAKLVEPQSAKLVEPEPRQFAEPIDAPLPDISFSNDDEDEDDGDYSDFGFSGNGGYLPQDSADYAQATSQDAAVPSLPVLPSVAKTNDENYEDPVAAILANRNLPIEDMFGGRTQEAQSEQAVTKPSAKPSAKLSTKPQVIAALPSEQSKVEATIAAAEAKLEVEPEDNQVTEVEVEVTKASVTVAIETKVQAQIPQVDSQAESAPQSTIPAHTAPIETQPQPEQPLPSAANEAGIPRWAADVDEWAALIEQMGLGGLVRLLAVKSIWHKQDKLITLTVAQSEQHLDSQGLRDQLEKGLVRVLNQVIELELVYTTEELATPFNIQRKIEADRLVHAKQLIFNDPIVVAFQKQFDAQVNEQSIAAVG